MQSPPTSKQIVDVFNILAKTETKDEFTSHIFGTMVTYRYIRATSVFQTVVSNVGVVIENRFEISLTFQEFLDIVKYSLNVVIKRNFGDN